MKLQDLIHLKGEVLIQEVDDIGTVSTLVDDRNLIVSNGRNTICKLLIGASSISILDIAFGTGGTVRGNSSVAIAVDPTDTTVKALVPAVKGTDYSFSKVADDTPSPRLVFNVVIPKEYLTGVSTITLLNGTGGIGVPISEIALMLSDNTAFAIKRFPSITKSASTSIIITWTIYI